MDGQDLLMESILEDRELRFITDGKEYILRKSREDGKDIWVLWRTWGEERFVASAVLKSGNESLKDVFTAIISQNNISDRKGKDFEIAIDIIERS